MLQILTRMHLKFLKYAQTTQLKKHILGSNLFLYKTIFKPQIISNWKMFCNGQEYEKATIVYNESKEAINICLNYFDKTLKIHKYFFFNRKPYEACNISLERMGYKINAYAERKAKKKGIVFSDPISLSIESKSGNPLDALNLSCADAFTCMDNYLRIGNLKYSLDINPQKFSLQLPRHIMANCLIYPSKLEGVLFHQDEPQLKWFRSKQKYESIEEVNIYDIAWEMAGEGLSIFVSSDDASRLLKLVGTTCNENQEYSDVEYISTALVSPGPGICPFQKRHQSTENILDEGHLRIVSYNILANCYADTEFSKTLLHPTIPAYALNFDYRKLLLLKEILGYNGDLICLQEVEPHVFENDFRPIFTRCGFEGIFHSKFNNKIEGLAMFYRKEKLTLRDKTHFNLSFELENSPIFTELVGKAENNEAFCNTFFRKKTILQVCVFSPKECPSKIVVTGSTHLLSQPNCHHIRLLQAGLCLNLLQNIVHKWKSQDPNNDVTLIFCGDFNSVPLSSVYRLITTGSVDQSDVDWRSKSGEEVEGVSLSHDMNLESACGVPEFTTYTAAFKGVLDYIFFEPDKFSVSQIVSFPSLEELSENGEIPSVTFPSDHIALVTDLKWLK